jgi:hypothetical protein
MLNNYFSKKCQTRVLGSVILSHALTIFNYNLHYSSQLKVLKLNNLNIEYQNLRQTKIIIKLRVG